MTERKTVTREELAAAREPLALVLESIVASWDEGNIDNYGATDLILAVIAKARTAAKPSPAPAKEEADALAGALDATGDELGRWVKKAETYRLGLADAAARANKAEAQRDQAWRNLDTAHEDIAAMLRASGLGDYARPISTHDVIQRELLPWIESRAALSPSTDNDPVAAVRLAATNPSPSGRLDALLDEYYVARHSKDSGRLIAARAALAATLPEPGEGS